MPEGEHAQEDGMPRPRRSGALTHLVFRYHHGAIVVTLKVSDTPPMVSVALFVVE